MKTLVKLCNWLLIGLGILLSIQALSEYSRGPNLYRGVNHKVTGLDNSTKSFSYIVFSDPQYGLLDIVDDRGDGTVWNHDLINMKRLADKVNAIKPKPSFIFCTGDLSNAYPESPKIENILNGFKSPYRTAQTVDLLDSLTVFNSDIPIMINAGNHDLTEDPDKLSVGAFEHVWGDTYFTFWSNGQFFISLETQFFRSSRKETKELLVNEIAWLEDVFANISPLIAKTVMMHVPLFIDNVNETDSDKGHSGSFNNDNYVKFMF